MTDTPAQLMTRAQNGHVDAFAQLYTLYRPQVLAYATSRHPGLGEDITQDVFVRALGALHTWQDQGKSPGGWLRTITINLCRDRAKSSHYQRSAPFDPGDYVITTVEADQKRTDPALLTVEHLVYDEVLTALQELTADQREALILFHLRELSLRETAERMGRGENAVKALLGRARRALAAHLRALADA